MERWEDLQLPGLLNPCYSVSHTFPPLKIVYLNSEMGDAKFRKRLGLFEGLRLDDWKFQPYHRASNFTDLITPEKKIFIIDFLEVTTDFWKVAQYIQEIHKNLKMVSASSPCRSPSCAYKSNRGNRLLQRHEKKRSLKFNMGSH